MMRSANGPLKKIFRLLLLGFTVFILTACLSLSWKKNQWNHFIADIGRHSSLNGQNEGEIRLVARQIEMENKPTPLEVIASQDRNEKVIIEKVDGIKVFRIEGLPSQKMKEVRKLFQPTTLPLKVKQEMAEKMKNIFEKRKKRLKESCTNKKSFRWTNDMQVIAVPQKDLTVCVVQKAGSSSWHRLVYGMREPNGTWNGFKHVENKMHGAKLSKEEKYRLMKSEKGTRVLTVRHPFARLISGWNDKLNKNHLAESTKILTSLNGIESYIGRHEPDEYHIIAFEDFVQYLVDKGLKGIDLHFRTIETLCHPCQYPYDYIAKAETSRNSLWWVLDRVGAVMPSYTKHTATGSGENQVDANDPWNTDKKIMTAFFRKIPKETVRKLKSLYQNDFDRFGYTFDLDTMTAGDMLD